MKKFVLLLVLIMSSCTLYRLKNNNNNDNGTSQVSAPVFTPSEGTVTLGTEISIESNTEGAKIYYTTNGADPTGSGSGSLYSVPIVIDDNRTFRAIAIKGTDYSDIVTATYTVATVADPVFDPTDGIVLIGTLVTITCDTPDSTIYYTTDGTDPTDLSTLYAWPVTINTSTTLKAVAYKDGYFTSGITSAVYAIPGSVATPTFDPVAGQVTLGTDIALSTTTSGASIYYTTDGTTPTTSSTLYDPPTTKPTITLTNTTVKAIAVKSGYPSSSVASATYTLPPIAAPTFGPTGGVIDDGGLVTISGPSGSTIYYTTNGTTPTRSSNLYSGPVALHATTMIKAFAIKAGEGDSPVASATYNPENIYAVGALNTYNGVTVNGLAKIKVDGSLDTNFNAGGSFFNNVAYSVVVQSDGKPVIGGYFSTYDHVVHTGLMRLNTDGSLDATFDPGGAGLSSHGYVYTNDMFIDGNGKIVAGGHFTSYDGTTRNNILRVNTDGSLDATFDPGTGFNSASKVYSVAQGADGKIITGGNFTTYNGTACNYVVRLNTDGSLDSTFNTGGSGVDGPVAVVAVQADGRIIITGNFTSYNGTARKYIARLNTDGTLDGTFDPGTGNSDSVGENAMAFQANGQLIVGDGFTHYNGIAINDVARINTDGTLDETFNPGTGVAGGYDGVYGVAIQSDGKIIIVGSFTSYNGTTRGSIARLNTDGSLDTSFLNTGAGANSYFVGVVIQPL